MENEKKVIYHAPQFGIIADNLKAAVSHCIDELTNSGCIAAAVIEDRDRWKHDLRAAIQVKAFTKRGRLRTVTIFKKTVCSDAPATIIPFADCEEIIEYLENKEV